MAKIIELVGIPGVGKSTTLKAMMSEWNKSSKWIPAHFLYPQKDLTLTSLNKLFTIIKRKIMLDEGTIDERAMKRYGERFLVEHPNFIDACWKSIFSESHPSLNGIDLRFEKANYLFITIQRFQLLKESEIDKYVVLDEGLIHRVANSFYSSDKLENNTNVIELFNNMPLPDALIHFDVSAEEAAKRLSKRKKVIISHQGLSLSELERSSSVSQEIINCIVDTIKVRNKRILRLDGKDSIEDNAKAIISFLLLLEKEENLSPKYNPTLAG